MNSSQQNNLSIKTKATLFFAKKYRTEKEIKSFLKYTGNYKHAVRRFRHLDSSYLVSWCKLALPKTDAEKRYNQQNLLYQAW